jgi:hypothetical protein
VLLFYRGSCGRVVFPSQVLLALFQGRQHSSDCFYEEGQIPFNDCLDLLEVNAFIEMDKDILQVGEGASGDIGMSSPVSVIHAVGGLTYYLLPLVA